LILVPTTPVATAATGPFSVVHVSHSRVRFNKWHTSVSVSISSVLVILIYMLRVHPHDYILIYHDSVPFWNREGSAIAPTSLYLYVVNVTFDSLIGEGSAT